MNWKIKITWCFERYVCITNIYDKLNQDNESFDEDDILEYADFEVRSILKLNVDFQFWN